MDKLWSTRQGNLPLSPTSPVITVVSLTTLPCHLSPVLSHAVNQNSAAFVSNHISQFWRLHLYGAVSRRTCGQKLEALNWSLSPIINTHFSHSCPSRIPFCYIVPSPLTSLQRFCIDGLPRGADRFWTREPSFHVLESAVIWGTCGQEHMTKTAQRCALQA